jgi:hypothetical protein
MDSTESPLVRVNNVDATKALGLLGYGFGVMGYVFGML